jgi:hypothetical protein
MPTPEPSEAAFSLAIAAGMRMAAELVHRAGPAAALDSMGDTLQSTLTQDEMGILRAAVTLIAAQREAAPDDLSGLGHVDLAPCADILCHICGGTR